MARTARKSSGNDSGASSRPSSFLIRSWASADGGTRKFPIKDIQYWREYVSGTVGRYKDDVKYWEVWNEFNGGFGDSIEVKPVPNKSALDFLDGYFERQRQSGDAHQGQ